MTALRAASYTAGLARRQGARVVAVYVAPLGSLMVTSSAGASVLAAEQQVHDEIAQQLAPAARISRCLAGHGCCLGPPITGPASHPSAAGCPAGSAQAAQEGVLRDLGQEPDPGVERDRAAGPGDDRVQVELGDLG